MIVVLIVWVALGLLSLPTLRLKSGYWAKSTEEFIETVLFSIIGGPIFLITCVALA